MTINKKPKTFEDAIKSLEEITNLMQNNNLDLEKSIEYYDTGKKLVEFCKNKLLMAEQKIKILENDELREFKIDKK